MRYRRDRLTVHTDDGPSEAWVYIDHRVDPGAPRPGYLERVVDGAVHHGLPQRWIEFLRRWDPSHWPMRVDKSGSACAAVTFGTARRSGIIEDSTLRSRFGFMAIHGGGLEQMTDVIAERAADAAGASVYVLRHPDRYPHHLPSARYRAQDPNGWPSSSTTSRSWCRYTDTAASGAAPSCWPAVATASSPNTWRVLSTCRLPGRHGPERDPARAAGYAPRQSGQPGPRRRHPTRTDTTRARHQPKKWATGRRRPEPSDIQVGAGPRRDRPLVATNLGLVRITIIGAVLLLVTLSGALRGRATRRRRRQRAEPSRRPRRPGRWRRRRPGRHRHNPILGRVLRRRHPRRIRAANPRPRRQHHQNLCRRDDPAARRRGQA